MTRSTLVLFADSDLSWTRPLRAGLRRRGARLATASSEADVRGLRSAPDAVVVDGTLRDDRGRPLEVLLRELFQNAIVLAIRPGTRTARGRLQVGYALERLLGERLRATSHPRPVVLCVDDDRFYLRALARLLGRHGYRVAAHEDPERALEAVPEVSPDLAIVDVRMPGMSGLDLASELRAQSPGIPVVLLSALGSDDDILRGYRQGASYYLAKPCAPRQVLNAVDYLIGDLEPQERLQLEAEL